MKRLQNRTAAAAFSTWRSWAETHAEHGAKLHACLVKLKNHTLAAAFSAWADRAARKRERQAGLQAALPKLMHRWQGFRLWIAAKCTALQDMLFMVLQLPAVFASGCASGTKSCSCSPPLSREEMSR